jgi:hypothetical protein
MLKSGNTLRFTPTEIEEARVLGLDLSRVKNEEQFTSAVLELITTLERERPTLLEKIAKALAAATGRKLPAQVRLVK